MTKSILLMPDAVVDGLLTDGRGHFFCDCCMRLISNRERQKMISSRLPDAREILRIGAILGDGMVPDAP